MRYFFSVLALLTLCMPVFAQQQCMGFDNLSGGYGANSPGEYGQVFHTAGDMTLAATGFQDATGGIDNYATVWAGTFLYSGAFATANGVFIKTNPTASLIIEVPAASEITFNVIDWNSMMNFSVNGEPVNVVNNLSDLPTNIAPGVTLSITDQMVGAGIISSVTLTGYMTEVLIGGDDMGIDDICFMPTAPVCQITGVTATPSACDPSGNFLVDIDFGFSDEGSNGFNVSGNGTNYGNFNYSDLPITIGPLLGDGITSFEFFVQDVDDPNCVNSDSVGVVNCPICTISNISAQPIDCVNDSIYTVFVDFDYQNTGGYGFDIYWNGNYLEYWLYSELPITMELPSTGAPTASLSFCDAGSQVCCESTIIDEINCGGFTCDINNVVLTPSACDAAGMFMVDLDFDYENAGSSFSVMGNGTNYGTFFYVELPITLGPFLGDGSTVYDFVVSDMSDPNCTDFNAVGPITCTLPCSITNAQATPLQCTSDSTFSMSINFDYSGVGNTTFDVFSGTGGYLATYAYSSLPVTIVDFAASGMTTEAITICDSGNTQCCITTTFEPLDCTPNTCSITNLSVAEMACDSAGFFGVLIDFSHVNTGSDFNILVNGSVASSYNYNVLPLTLFNFLPGDGTTTYTITIQDAVDPNCSASSVIQPVDCGGNTCMISNIVVDPIQCVSDSLYSMFIDFDSQNGGSNGFDVFVMNEFLGNYLYSDLPLTLNNIPSTIMASQTIVICDVSDPSCCEELAYTPLDCTPANCELSNLTTTLAPCDSNELFSVQLDFTAVNAAATFTVMGNGTNYGTFNYADLPINIGPLAGDGMTAYEFIITDTDSPNCILVEEVGVVNCNMDCELFEPVADPQLCTSDSTFNLYLDFDYANVSGTSFTVSSTGYFGTFNYTDLPLEILDFPSMGTSTIQVQMCDTSEPNCCVTTSFESIECGQGCNIFNVTAEPYSCEQGLFLVDIDLEFQNPGPLGFQVFGNGNNYGNFSYSDLPITIGAFNGDGVTAYEFVVADLTNTDCINFVNIEPVDCLDNCIFTDMIVTASDCDDNEFMVTVDFNYNNVSAEGFELTGNGTSYGNYFYGDPVVVGPFVGDGQTVYEFILTDLVNTDCSTSSEVMAPDCSGTAVVDPFDGIVNVYYDFIGSQVVVAMEQPFNETTEIILYDATGRMLINQTIAAGESDYRIDISKFNSGLFIAQLRNSEGSLSRSFVKK